MSDLQIVYKGGVVSKHKNKEVIIMTQDNQIEKANKIKDGYLEKTPGKFDELKKLDSKVKTPPTALAYVLGILGALVMGVGMCICLGVLVKDLLPVGVVVGVVGIAMMIANVFIYKKFLSTRKKKYAESIIKLADELQA